MGPLLSVEAGLYYRFHHRDAPFGPDDAATRNLGTPPDGLERYWEPRSGYSAFWHPNHLYQYLEEHGWLDADDACERQFVAFHGRAVGEGADGEPRVIPDSTQPVEVLSLEEFVARMPEAGTRWSQHTWGDGPDGPQVDDGYRTLRT